MQTPCLPAQNAITADEAIRDWEEQIRIGPQPSRNRLIQSALAATAATSQKSGTALTGFTPRGLSPEVALQLASRIGPFGRALNTAVPIRSRETIRRPIINTCTVKTQRRRTIRHLKRVSLTLQPPRERLAAILPVRTPARKINIPLVMFLVRRLNYPDTRLPSDLVKGMEIPVNIQPSKSLTKREMIPSSNISRLKTNLVARNENIFRHLQRSNNPTLQTKCWEMSVAEYEKGWLSKPTSAAQHDRAFTVLSPIYVCGPWTSRMHTKRSG